MRQLAVIIIPARLASKRLPRKVLAEINGKSVLQTTYEQAVQAKQPYAVAIAVDESKELYDHAKTFAQYVFATPDSVRCGTSRVANVARNAVFSKADVVVNVQADEIDIDPDLIDQLVQALSDDSSLDMVTAVVPREAGDTPSQNSTVAAVLEDEKLVDLVRFKTDNAPKAYLEHIGIAAFRKHALFKYLKLSPSNRDRTQGNEYLTAIDAGFNIGIVTNTTKSLNSVNTQEDLARVVTPKVKKKRLRKTKKKG